MTYSEKLRDPRWQKKRLERLEKAGWCCDCCGASDNTLHVHHNDYFKSREPWEYDLNQLTVLCAGCHSDEHENEDRLLLAASRVGIGSGPYHRDTVASLVAGFCFQPIGDVADPDAYMLGELVSHMAKPPSHLGRPLTCMELEALIGAIDADPAAFSDALRKFAGLVYAAPRRFIDA